jgi:predicted TIM-barrel fold metal-dependent hydrolase
MKQNLPDRIIDFHVHLFPDKLFDAIRRYFIKAYRLRIRYDFYYRECIAYLRQHGVEKIVYSNYAHREGIAEGLNRWNRQILEEYPDLYCFAAHHPGDANALSDAENILQHPRVLGIKLHFHVQRLYPYDQRLLPLYDLIMSRKKRLLIHIGSGPLGNEFVGVAPFRKLLSLCPTLPAVIAHMGQFEYQEFMDLLDEYPALYLDTAFSFFKEQQGLGGFNLGAESLEKHKDRIVYGSDFPNLILPRESELETLDAFNLSREFYQKVFFDNANHLIASIARE